VEVQQRRIQVAGLWLLAAIGLMVIATSELHRVRSGRLFLFPTAFDNQPSIHELHDAEASARRWLLPALLAIGCACGLGYFLGSHRRDGSRQTIRRTWRTFSVALLLAAALDLFTTLSFFHERGIDVELHPGVRLLGYAYGRTAGPVIAKTTQVVGILWLSERLPRGGNALLATTSLVYALAAAHNAGWLTPGP